jgi:hypothetical protein
MGANALHKSVHLGIGTHQLATQEVKRLNQEAAKEPGGGGERRTITSYLDAAVHYFGERGLDPVATHEREGAAILREVKRLGDRVFSYLQDQEQGVHQALLEEVVRGRIIQQVMLAGLQDIEGKLYGYTPAQIKESRARDLRQIETDVLTVMGNLRTAEQERRAAKRQAKTGQQTPPA